MYVRPREDGNNLKGIVGNNWLKLFLSFHFCHFFVAELQLLVKPTIVLNF